MNKENKSLGTKLYLTELYLLWVSFNKIQEGDNYVNPCDLLDMIPISLDYHKEDNTINSYCVKILAHRPLNGASVIPSIELLPELKLDKPDTFPVSFDGTNYKY